MSLRSSYDDLTSILVDFSSLTLTPTKPFCPYWEGSTTRKRKEVPTDVTKTLWKSANRPTGRHTANALIRTYEKAPNEQIKENQRYLRNLLSKPSDSKPNGKKPDKGKDLPRPPLVNQSLTFTTEKETHERSREYIK